MQASPEQHAPTVYKEFENLLQQLLVKLNACLAPVNETRSEAFKQALFLQAKSSLIELCLQKICAFLHLESNPVVGPL